MTQRRADQLAREGFNAIPRYSSGADVEIDLSDNTNAWGTPPAARSVLRAAAGTGAARYPDLYGESLKRTVADRAGISPACVVTGNGSDDVLDCAIRAFAAPGDTIAHPDPTFVMLPVFSRINNIRPVPVPLTADYAMDADALLATGARIIYLCSPNNPTGTATPADVIRKVIAHALGLVIVDEAYAEFAGVPGLLSEAPSLERVLVCRTFSKAYGLAGLRVGYGTATPAIIETIERSRGPYKLNIFAERAAVAAMTDDAGWVVERAAEAVANRVRLSDALSAMGLSALPSATNFLLVPTPKTVVLAARLRANGIGIRAFQNLPGLGDAMRITAGPWPVMERVLSVIADGLEGS